MCLLYCALVLHSMYYFPQCDGLRCSRSGQAGSGIIKRSRQAHYVCKVWAPCLLHLSGNGRQVWAPFHDSTPPTVPGIPVYQGPREPLPWLPSLEEEKGKEKEKRGLEPPFREVYPRVYLRLIQYGCG